MPRVLSIFCFVAHGWNCCACYDDQIPKISANFVIMYARDVKGACSLETTTERLHALFRKYPELADGEHDKDLIAKYLALYHNFTIPIEVLREIPSFETIRRTRQYYCRDMGSVAAADLETKASFEDGVRWLSRLVEVRGYELAPASPMIKQASGMEPTVFGINGDLSLVGVVEFIPNLIDNRAAVKKLLDLLTWVQGAPGMDRNPIVVLLGDLSPAGKQVIDELKMYGWEVHFI